jgi:F-type H+-transporting ATPase subunit gamma
MSQLVHVRQRIQTIETIKRITNAMRLVSRSSHFRLNKQKKAVQAYCQSVAHLFFGIQKQYPTWQYLSPTTHKQSNILYILVGSHKGLCGNFNGVLFSFFDRFTDGPDASIFHLITIGHKANEYGHAQYPHYVMSRFLDHTIASIASTSEHLAKILMAEQNNYKKIFLISNKVKNFFIYYPHATQLIPFIPPASSTTLQESTIEGDPYYLLNYLSELYLKTTIQALLFESLLAEQAARFISMDSATRNADTILENTRLSYNKLRQAKITKDMIEISSLC